MNFNCDLLGFIGPSANDITNLDSKAQQLLSSYTLTRPSPKLAVYARHGSAANRNNNIHAVITGCPRWKNKKLTDIAIESGHAQALIIAFLDYDTKLFQHLSGHFTLALYNKESNRLIISVDKIGRQHLYYSIANDNIIFGTKASFIQALSNTQPKYNKQALFEYFYFHSIPSPLSIFEATRKLIGGHYLEFNDTKVSLVQYWQPKFTETLDDHSLSDLKHEMHEIIENSVSQYANRDDVGAFLSGGLDSSTVSGMLAKNSLTQAKTFSIGFDVKGYDETHYARLASKHFKTKHHEYYVTPDDIVNMVPKIAQNYDEPFGNSSALPAYFCAKLAKEHGVSLILGGDGGDEIFAGNERYAKQATFEYYQCIPNIIKNTLIEPVFLNTQPNTIKILQKVKSYIAQANIPLPDRMEAYNFLQRFKVSTIFTESFLDDINPQGPIDSLRKTYHSPVDASSLNRMMYLDWKRTLQDNDLVKVNQMCQLAGLNVAYPLLDDRLIDFSCKIPSKIKLKGNNLRWFFKQSMSGFLPAEIINKPKHGFGLPFGIWTKEHPELKSLAYDCVNSFKSRNIIKPGFIEEALRMHKTEHAAYYGELIWLIMMLELWMASHTTRK